MFTIAITTCPTRHRNYASTFPAARMIQSALLATVAKPRRGYVTDSQCCDHVWLVHRAGAWTLSTTNSYTMSRWWLNDADVHVTRGDKADVFTNDRSLDKRAGALAIGIPIHILQKVRATRNDATIIVTVNDAGALERIASGSVTVQRANDAEPVKAPLAVKEPPTFLYEDNAYLAGLSAESFDSRGTTGTRPIVLTADASRIIAALAKIWKASVSLSEVEATGKGSYGSRNSVTVVEVVNVEGVPRHQIMIMNLVVCTDRATTTAGDVSATSLACRPT